MGIFWYKCFPSKRIITSAYRVFGGTAQREHLQPYGYGDMLFATERLFRTTRKSDFLENVWIFLNKDFFLFFSSGDQSR